jgi:hypothetical protein
MSSKRCATIITAAAAGLGLGGCTTVDPGFGEAYRYDMAIQTVDPDPVYPEDGAKPGDSGAVAAEASDRYRTGRVKPVESGTAGGSGASVGSGGGPN